ncbi:unnamed protein product [Ectocarpus fasciculatus]
MYDDAGVMFCSRRGPGGTVRWGRKGFQGECACLGVGERVTRCQGRARVAVHHHHHRWHTLPSIHSALEAAVVEIVTFVVFRPLSCFGLFFVKRFFRRRGVFVPSLPFLARSCAAGEVLS